MMVSVKDESKSNDDLPTTASSIPAYIVSDNLNPNKYISRGHSPLPRISTELLKKLEKGVDVLKAKVGDEHIDVAVAVDAVARAYSDNKDYDSALHHYNDALALKEKILPPQHPSIADTVRSIGNVLQKMGAIQESEESYKTARLIYRHAFDDQSWVPTDKEESKHQTLYDLHHMISQNSVNIGNLHYDREEHERALIFYEESLREAKMSAVDAVILSRHVENSEISHVKETRLFVCDIMNNIANVYAQMGHKQKAIKQYNEALNLQMKEVGEDHLSVCSTLHNMGTLHYHTGEYQLAIKCYKQVLKMRRFLLGSEHISIADTLINVAIVHDKANELDRAESALQAALRVLINAFDKKDFRVAFVEDCLGALNARNGFDLDALACFSRALDIYKQSSFDDDHPLVVSTKKSMEYVRNKEKNKNDCVKNTVEVDMQATDLMSAFLTCGGLCFSNNKSVAPLLV